MDIGKAFYSSGNNKALPGAMPPVSANRLTSLVGRIQASLITS
jgi:hypothetical protein